MKITEALLADYANVSREGKLNVLGIFSTILTRNFPVVHSQMQLILMWEASRVESGRKKKIEIELREEDGAKIFSLGGELFVPEGEPGKPICGNQIIILSNLRFEKPGDYVFYILINEEKKAEVPFEVRQVSHSEKG